MNIIATRIWPLAVFGSLLLTGCQTTVENKAAAPWQYQIAYNGVDDDLLTAGLGLEGLRSTPPQLPDNPSAKQLRRASYHTQFKALNDLNPAHGYGQSHGISSSQKAIAGTEYWAQRQLNSTVSHTTLLQVPEQLNTDHPCLVVAPSSGSRNVLGAVGTTGAWALSQGCAVVYTDKGTGTEIATSQGSYQLNGLWQADTIEGPVILKSGVKNQVVFKHAYSQTNPEQWWGHMVLDSIEYALASLSRLGYSSNDFLVLAASVSNGGGAVVKAAELDTKQLIDAVVAAEPQLFVNEYEFIVNTSDHTAKITSQPLIELANHAGMLQPCASLSVELKDAPFSSQLAVIKPMLELRCQQLAEHGFLDSENELSLPEQAIDQLKTKGWTTSSMTLLPFNTLTQLWASINITYTNSYLQSEAKELICDVGYSAFNAMAQSIELGAHDWQNMFALSSGIAPTLNIEPAYFETGQLPSKLLFQPGYGFAPQHCLYQQWQQAKQSKNQYYQHVQSTSVTGKSLNIPMIILHGTADGIVSINHSSRAYYHKAKQLGNHLLRLYEIETAQHFDALLSLPDFDKDFAAMHPHLEAALDLMWLYLTKNEALPASQQVLRHSPISEHPQRMITTHNQQLIIKDRP